MNKYRFFAAAAVLLVIFILAVPAVIGEGTLFRYATMGQVFNFIRAEMPLEHPGVLSDEEYLAIAAFLAQSHDVWDGTRLTTSNVEQVRLRPTALMEDGQQSSKLQDDVPITLDDAPISLGDAPELSKASGETVEENPQNRYNRPAIDGSVVWLGIALALIFVAGGWLWLRLK